MINYEEKYLKYKNKYFKYKNQDGGANIKDKIKKNSETDKVYKLNTKEIKKPEKLSHLKERNKTFKKVAKQNTLLNVEKDLTEYNIYKIYPLLDKSFKPCPWSLSAIYDIIVNAKNTDEAFEFIQTLGMLGGDTDHFWKDKKYLVFELIGKSYLNKVILISKNGQEDTG
jgi:hypothetical protein